VTERKSSFWIRHGSHFKNNSMYTVIINILIFLTLVFSFSADASTSTKIDQDSKILQEIHAQLEQPVDMQQLLNWHKSTSIIKDNAQKCISDKNNQLKQTDNGLGILGPAVTGEPENLTALRTKLLTRQKDLQGEIATCKVIAVASTDLEQEIEKKRDNLHAQILLRKDQNIWAQINTFSAVGSSTWTQEKNYWFHHNHRFIFAQKNLQVSIAIGLFVFYYC
jgi:hypothetical protein